MFILIYRKGTTDSLTSAILASLEIYIANRIGPLEYDRKIVKFVDQFEGRGVSKIK